jgi:bacillithiol biosynthesis cysteine-adding enzyme BshC
MTLEKIPYSDIPQLSDRDKAYALGNGQLKPFYKYEVSLAQFEQVIKDKKQHNTNREVLVRVLQEQYEKYEASDQTVANIESLLEENTFTVTTAHQPSLFTGPLYYIYKILSTIHLAKRLSQEYPDYKFIPLFITGGEDHDFEEINHFNLFGKTVSWENEESGPVGMMSTESLEPVLQATKEILGDSPRAEALYAMLESAVHQHKTYAGVAIHLTNLLFRDYGLVILDPSHKSLKTLFIPYIEKEILEQPSKALVESTVAELEKAGFSEQAYPREINFFYLQPGSRSRIVEENRQFSVLDSGLSFTKEEIQKEIKAHPERFSPNVVMRPIYQELILPNLAYIGGGGELAYWLERKRQFEHFGINFPMLIRRNSVLFIDKGTQKRIDKLELTAQQLFGDVEALIKEYVRQNTENELSLADEKAALNEIFEKVKKKADEIDPTLVKATAAEGARQLNSLEQLEGKLMRAEKQRHDVAINQMRTLKDKLFPNNGLQERSDNFMTFYLKYGNEFFDMLLPHLNPLEKGFLIIKDA